MLNFLVAIKGVAWIFSGTVYWLFVGAGPLYNPTSGLKIFVTALFVGIGLICLSVWRWLEYREHMTYRQSDRFENDCRNDLILHLRDPYLAKLFEPSIGLIKR